MPDVSQLMAGAPPLALDPEAVNAANLATNQFLNPPVPVAAPPFANVSPEEAARLGIAFPPATLPGAQAAGAALQAPPVAAAPAEAPPPAIPGPPLSPAVQASVNHAGAGPATHVVPPDVNAEAKQIQQASQATQGAIVEQGAAQAAESDAEAQARQLGGERMAAHQDVIREQQAQRDQAIRAINADQQAAYDEAHRATIPDFFEGRFGAKAAAAVSIALGEASRGLLAFGTGANVGNTAKDIIDRQITNYLQDKRIEIDNLFKYAAARNMLGEQQKQQWATKLNELQFEASAIHQAMADHVLEVAAASKGRINQTTAKVLANTQAQTAVELEQKARETNFNNQISARRLGIESYNAQSERMRALQDKQAQVEIKIGQQIDGDLGALEKRVAKPREALGKIDDIVTQMDSAYAAKDPNKLAAAIVALKEGVGPLFAGGKTTGNLTKQLDALGTTKDEIQKTLGKITGGNTVGDTMFKRLREMALIGAHEKADSIGKDRGAYMNKYLGPGGLANTPEKKQRFLNDLNGITSTITVGGQPLFQEGGAPEHVMSTPPAPAQSQYPVGTKATSGGKPIVWNGSQWVAQ